MTQRPDLHGCSMTGAAITYIVTVEKEISVAILLLPV